MLFKVAYSHLFPGAAVTVEDDGGQDGAGQIEFADGSAALARWRRDAGAITLDVPSYRTAKGTDVDARRWSLTLGEGGTWRAARA